MGGNPKSVRLLIWNLTTSKCFDDLTELLAFFRRVETIEFNEPGNQAIQSFIGKLDRRCLVPIVLSLISD